MSLQTIWIFLFRRVWESNILVYFAIVISYKNKALLEGNKIKPRCWKREGGWRCGGGLHLGRTAYVTHHIFGGKKSKRAGGIFVLISKVKESGKLCTLVACPRVHEWERRNCHRGSQGQEELPAQLLWVKHTWWREESVLPCLCPTEVWELYRTLSCPPWLYGVLAAPFPHLYHCAVLLDVSMLCALLLLVAVSEHILQLIYVNKIFRLHLKHLIVLAVINH